MVNIVDACGVTHTYDSMPYNHNAPTFLQTNNHRQASLAGTVKKYDAHLFLVWRAAAEWPKSIEVGYGPEAPETLPQAVSTALAAHKKSLPGKVSGWGREGRCMYGVVCMAVG